MTTGTVSSNYLLVVADSARHDTATASRAPFLRRQGTFQRAWAQATFTWPAHMAMMVGMLPHSFDDRPLYNRYRRQLWRLGYDPGNGGPLAQPNPVERLLDGESIPEAFERRGYFTIGSGGLGWFRHPIWKRWFEEFSVLQRAEEQVGWLTERIQSNASRPFFAFVNFRETHEPYSFGTERFTMPDGWQAHKLGHGPLSPATFAELRSRQVRAFEHLDIQIEHLCTGLPPNTVVVVTADHGECFGEDGFIGHGFFHPAVMEVPILIFRT